MKCAICGANGKMGQTIISALHDTFDFSLVTRAFPLSNVIDDIDVVVDFTCANSSFQNAIQAIQHHKPIIIGTTGLTGNMLKLLQEQANEKKVGCLYAPNFSYGAIWMSAAVQELANTYDSVEIKEIHHVSKVDTPSGTALRLKESMQAINPNILVHINSERHYSKNVIHQLTFYKEGESITLMHLVSSKIAYLKALEFAIRKIESQTGWVEYSHTFFKP